MSAEDVSQLRLLVDEPTTDAYSDSTLQAKLDAVSGSMYRAAAAIWEEKAARFASLVDISEGGSSRKNSSLQQQAVVMRNLFAAKAEVSSGTRIGKLVRK